MLIVEGPDGGGKTTLALALGRVLGRDVIHAGGPPRSEREVLDRLEDQRKSYGKILDRCTVVSERVYGTALAGKSFLSANRLSYWETRFVERGWILVYCRPSDETIKRYVARDLFLAGKSKAHKPENHCRRVCQEIDRILELYDETIARLRKKGMIMWTFDRDKLEDAG